jgi:hypothetical protein
VTPPTPSIICKSCGRATPIDLESDRGPLVIHRDACPFLAAVKAGKGREWIAEHGSPHSTTTDAPS